MSKPWFDPATGDLLFDDYVAEMPSYRKIMQDEVVSEDEVDRQAGTVLALLRRLEDALTPEQKELVTEALCELAVLNELQLKALGLVPRRDSQQTEAVR